MINEFTDTPNPSAGRNPTVGAAAAEPRAADVSTRTALAFVVLVAVMLTLGAFGRFVVFDSAIGDAEHNFVGWVAENRTSVLDSLATVGSTLTDTWTVIGVLVGAVSMLVVTGHGRFAAMIAIGITLELATFLLVGAIIDRERPEVEALHSVPSTPSFPSGHVAAAFVLYGSLVLVARRLAPTGQVPQMTWVIPLAVALIVAASRVYEGVHYPTDVVGGFILGVGAWCAAGLATGVLHVEAFRRAPNDAAKDTM